MSWSDYVFEDPCESMERSYEDRGYSNNEYYYEYDPLFYFKKVKAVFNDYSDKAFKVEYKGRSFFFPKKLVRTRGNKTYVHKAIWKLNLLGEN